MTAGLMEIAEVFCVNKADRDGSERLVRDRGRPRDAPERAGPPSSAPSASAERGVRISSRPSRRTAPPSRRRASSRAPPTNRASRASIRQIVDERESVKRA